jgi:hypothetical protein
MPVLSDKQRALLVPPTHRAAVSLIKELVMPVTLAALHRHAQPAKRAHSWSYLATMQHALLAPTATQRLGARPKERRLEVNAVCVLQVTLVLALAAQLGAWGLLLASIP